MPNKSFHAAYIHLPGWLCETHSVLFGLSTYRKKHSSQSRHVTYIQIFVGFSYLETILPQPELSCKWSLLSPFIIWFQFLLWKK